MSATITRQEIAAGFVLAAITLCAGFYFSMRAVGVGGTAILQVFGWVACLIVVKYTFALGSLRGFAVRNAEGGIHVVNLARNLVASLIAIYLVVFLSAPFIAVIVRHAR